MSHQITVKTCSKCKIEKHPSDFHKRPSSKDGLEFSCKECRKIYTKNNADRLREYHKNYAELQKNIPPEITGRVCSKCNEHKLFSEFSKNKYKKYGVNSECKKCILKTRQTPEEREKQHRYNRTEKQITYKRQYQQNNSDKSREKTNRWRKNNLELVRKRDRDRFKFDPVYAIRKRIQGSLLKSLRKRGYTKKSHTYEVLGCDYETFAAHIESQFKDGMSWDNRGAWEIDHIIPLASAKTEDDIIRLNHYFNLQPLWKIDNIRKRDKMPSLHIQEKIISKYKNSLKNQPLE